MILPHRDVGDLRVLPGGPGAVLGDEHAAHHRAAVEHQPAHRSGAHARARATSAHVAARHHRRRRHATGARWRRDRAGVGPGCAATSPGSCSAACPRHAMPPSRAGRDAAGEALDTGLALYFPAPHSFTGEHVLELHGHGGDGHRRRLIERMVQLGARRARPGEFSERAFLNDKLDLAQAEADRRPDRCRLALAPRRRRCDRCRASSARGSNALREALISLRV